VTPRNGKARIADALAHDVRETISYLRGARLPQERWDALAPALERLGAALATGDVAAVIAARDELVHLGPSRRAPMASEGGSAATAPGPRPIPEHVNKLIHGIWSDLTGAAPSDADPGGAEPTA